jgi:hypothetical protein
MKLAIPGARQIFVVEPTKFNLECFKNAQLLCRIPCVPTDKCGQTAPLFSAGEEPLYAPLRQWAESTKTHPTDQNRLCEYRYNRHVYCAGKIPPASESAVVWQMRIPPPVPEAFAFKSLLQRIHREKTLIRAQRESRARLKALICGYDSDWQTQAEREDLLRATKKARRSPNGLPPRRIVKGEDGNVPLNVVPTLKTGSLSKPPDALLDEWNKKLYEVSKDEKTPLREEIDFYQQPISEHGDAEHRRDGRERSPDDEKLSERQFDGVNYDGTRETGDWQKTEQGEPVPEPRRERWLASRRTFFNPLGKKWSEVTADDIADVTEHPDFARIAREYEIQFSNLRVSEAAEQLGLKPNTLSQQISRQELTGMFHDVEFSKIIGNYFCVVSLNGRNHLKILGKSDTSLKDVMKAFVGEQKKSEANAIKQARKSAKAESIDKRATEKREREAVERIRDAYDTVIGLFVPDADEIGGTYYNFLGYEELLKAAANDPRAEGPLQALAEREAVEEPIR